MKRIAISLALMFTLIATTLAFSGCDKEYTFAEVGTEYTSMLTKHTDIFTSGVVSIDYDTDMQNAINSGAHTDPFSVLTKNTSNAFNQLDSVLSAALLPLKIYARATETETLFAKHNSAVEPADASALGNRLATFKSQLADFKKVKKELENKVNFSATGSFELNRLNKLIVEYRQLNVAAINFSKKFLQIYEESIFVSGNYGGGAEEHLTAGLVQLELVKKVVEYAEIYAKTEMKLVGKAEYTNFVALSEFLKVYNGFKSVEALSYPAGAGPIDVKEKAIIDAYLNMASYNGAYTIERNLAKSALASFDYNLVAKIINVAGYKLPADKLVYYQKIQEFFAREMVNARLAVSALVQSVIAYNLP